MTPEQLAAIRERVLKAPAASIILIGNIPQLHADACALLAYVEELEKKVKGFEDAEEHSAIERGLRLDD